MAIRLGTLLPGAQPVGIGKKQAKRGFAIFSDVGEKPVIVKDIPAVEIAVEVFCALLGRSAGLSIPEPAVIWDPSSNHILFGSVDAGYPNLLQRFNITGDDVSEEQVRVIASRLVMWTKLAEGVCFDEWIWNVDRNLQNLLWDGHDEFVMIDHGSALGYAPKGHADQNLLLEVSLVSCDDSKKEETLQDRVMQAISEFEPQFAEEAARNLQQAPHLEAADSGQKFLSFLKKRFPQLASLLLKRFPSPQLSIF